MFLLRVLDFFPTPLLNFFLCWGKTTYVGSRPGGAHALADDEKMLKGKGCRGREGDGTAGRRKFKQEEIEDGRSPEVKRIGCEMLRNAE